MTSLNDVVAVTITANTRNPTQQGFGTPFFLSYHTRFSPDRVRTYADLAEMSSDGFVNTDTAYRMAEAAFAQNPRPEVVKIGRLPLPPAYTQTITITSAVEGETVSFEYQHPTSRTWTELSYTILPAETTTTVATAVELLIEAIAGVSSSSSAEVITVTPATPGGKIYFRNLQNCTLKDTTTDANYDDELTAVETIDNDFYFIAIDSSSEANNDLVAAWTETRTKMFVFHNSDYAEKAGTGTQFSDLETLGYDRTVGVFADSAAEYAQCAAIGRAAPKNPGSITWKFGAGDGVTAVTLTTTQESNLIGNNANYYTEVAGITYFTEGVTASGEFVDIIHGIDWLTARIQERVFSVLVNSDKIPYTNAGVNTIKSAILAVLKQAVDRGFLVANTLTVTAPNVADVDPADKAARLLPDVKFGADLAGAIHKVSITGTLAV